MMALAGRMDFENGSTHHTRGGESGVNHFCNFKV